MNHYKTQRLSKDDYVRPAKTFQQNLSEEEIKEKLMDYERVENISKVPLNTHIRYFAYLQEGGDKKRLKRAFRMGGFLTNKDNYEKYIILSNGTKSWSVNTEKSIIYRKLKPDEIMEKSEKKLRKKYEREISSLREIMSEKDKEIASLKSRISDMRV